MGRSRISEERGSLRRSTRKDLDGKKKGKLLIPEEMANHSRTAARSLPSEKGSRARGGAER